MARRAFIGRLDDVRALGFDERFIRMWEYYLALSEAGFATGISQDLQIVLEKRRGLALTTPRSVTPQRFPIRIGRRSQLVLLLFGVRPANAYVDLGDDELDAHFGFFRFRTPTSNLTSWRIEGPWRWITAIGVRFSVRDHDLTFGGTNRGGVRVDFKEPVRVAGVRVPALYLTVDDLEGFAAALGRGRAPRHRHEEAGSAWRCQTRARTTPWRTPADRDPLASLGRTSSARRPTHTGGRIPESTSVSSRAAYECRCPDDTGGPPYRLRTSSATDEADRPVLVLWPMESSMLSKTCTTDTRRWPTRSPTASRIDSTLAEDVVQDAFRAWRNAARYVEGRGSVKTWLLAIVHHRAIDAVRRRRPTTELPDIELPPPAAFTPPDVGRGGRRLEPRPPGALAALSDAQREAIELAYFGGLTEQEIADRTAPRSGRSRAGCGWAAGDAAQPGANGCGQGDRGFDASSWTGRHAAPAAHSLATRTVPRRSFVGG